MSVARVSTVLGVLALAALPSLAAAAAVGAPAPDFTLTDDSGNEVKLSAIEGVRVLEWVNPDCPFVQRHYKAGTMTGLAAAYGDRGVTWLTVNSTEYMDAGANREFREANELTRPILVDQDGTVGHLYGAQTTPHMFVIDGDGKVVYNGAIDDDPRGGKGAGAVNHVAAALEDVLAGREVATAETRPYGCSVKYAK